MAILLDTSLPGGLFVEADAFAARAAAFFTETNETLIVTDFIAAGFASVIARLTRTGDLREAEAQAIFDGFDTWLARHALEEDVIRLDIRRAAAMIRRLDLTLRAPDAIHLTTARGLGASVATFDNRRRDNALALGLALASA